MKRNALLIAAWLGGCTWNAMAQQVVQTDVAGDKVYQRVCREYELKTDGCVDLLESYLDMYPDSRHAEKVRMMIASTYFDQQKYKEAIALYQTCNLEALPNKDRDESIFRLASAYMKENNLKEATVWFRMLKEISEKHQADADYNLGYIDYTEKRYDKALKTFTALENDKVYAKLVPYYIAEINLLKGNHQQARTMAEKYLQQYPGHKDEAQMKRILGEAAFEQHDYSAAIEALEAYVAAGTTQQRKSMYDLGMSYFHTGVYSKATSNLGKVVTVSDPLTQNAYLHMGLAYLRLKQRNQARMSFEQAAAADFDQKVKEQALYNYALCIHETSYSAFAESVTVFERFLNEFPNSPYTEKVNDYLIDVYMNTRSYEAALKSIAKIQYPGNRIMEAKQKLLYRLGTEAFVNADFSKAVDYFNQSLRIGQYNLATKADAYYWLGESKYRLNNFKEANSDFKQYLSLTPNAQANEYGWALYNLGYTEFKQKHYTDARQWFERYVALGSRNERTAQADAYNRIGDCSFEMRQFDAARGSYAQAVSIDPSLGDYSLYQEAFVKGLQRDYTGKIQLLNRLLKEYPQSQHIDNALYEQGRAFVQLENNANAIERYNLLVERFPESNLARRAANEIGLLYYQNDKFPEAIQAYKKVIATYPGSEESRLAQRDLKSIYIDLNKVDEYVAYASSIPGGANFEVGERDSLSYVAAERVYMKGNIAEAKRSFTQYLQSFPEGAFSLNANFYIGLIDYNNKAYETAAQYLDKVLAYPNNKYSEEAMLMSAEIAYNGKDYQKALSIYKVLKDKAASAERVQLALTGMLRSACALDQQEDIVWAATALLNDSKILPELKAEAMYQRAKAYVKGNEMPKAMADWQLLSADTRNVYGAEAKYRLAQAYFDGGQVDKAEKELLNYIEVSTPHAYWLARSFVLLSDVYVALNKQFDAKQYLLSLKQNYQADDDIAGMIEERLSKLNAETKKAE